MNMQLASISNKKRGYPAPDRVTFLMVQIVTSLNGSGRHALAFFGHTARRGCKIGDDELRVFLDYSIKLNG